MVKIIIGGGREASSPGPLSICDGEGEASPYGWLGHEEYRSGKAAVLSSSRLKLPNERLFGS